MSLFTTTLTDIQPEPVEKVVIPLGEWLPDQAAEDNPGALEALNVIPLKDGSYGPMPSLVLQSNSAFPEDIQGAVASSIAPTNITQLYAGGASGIYTKLSGTAPVQIYSAAVSQEYPWQFIPFKTLMIALHRDTFPVSTTVGSTTAPVVLGGSPPRAACGAMCGDFLVLGNLLDDPADAHNAAPNRIRWSGIKNINANWVSDNTTQADYNDMRPEGGSVVNISGGTLMTIFQERKISVGRYVNLPQVWEIETVEDDIGCISRDCVVNVGPFKFFIANDGFRMWAGTNSQKIGDGKVDRYFFNKLQYPHRGRICGVYDVKTHCVYWAFPTGADGSLNEIIIYSLDDGRFTHTVQTLDWLVGSFTSSLTVDDLTTFTDSDPRYVDDPTFLAGGQPVLSAISESHNYGMFNGSAMAATIDTGEFSGPESRRVFVNLARPIVDIDRPIISVQPFGRDELSGAPLLSGTAVTQEIDGNCPILGEARYMRFRISIPAAANWKHARGIQIARKAGGQF